MHAGLPFLEDDREEEAEKREGGGRDDFSSDLSEDDDDEDGGGGKYPAKPRVGVLAAESDRHSEFSVSADEDEQSNPNETKGGAREAKSKSIFDDTDGSSDEGGGLFDRRPPAGCTGPTTARPAAPVYMEIADFCCHSQTTSQLYLAQNILIDVI